MNIEYSEYINMNIETKIKLDQFKLRPYQIQFAHALETDNKKRLLIVWPRRCLSGSSHILLSNGSYKLLRDIVIGDEILSWDGSSFVPDVVINKWSTGIKNLHSVQSPRYLPLLTSGAHVFAATNPGRSTFFWKPLKDLGKYALLLNYGGSNHGDISNPDLAEFYGYMLADGYVSAYQQPKFTNTNTAILKRVEELAIRLFDCKVIWREKGNGFDLGLSNGTRGGGAFHNPIKELFRNDDLDVPKSQKRLPPILWNMDEQSLGRYFAGLLSADGNLYCHNKGFTATDTGHAIPPSQEISIHCGRSYELAFDIYWLLRKMGILPQIPKQEKESNWKLKISKGVDIKKILSYGPIYGKEDQQTKMLKACKDTFRKVSLWHGCFRSRYSSKPIQAEELFDIQTQKNHNFVANGYVVHNSGKDAVSFFLMIRQAIMKVGVYFMIYPTYNQGRKILWDNVTNGKRVLDMIPPELIESRNEQQMRIRFTNGSLIQVLGSENYNNSLVGTNPIGVCFSEYAISNPEAWHFVQPILAENNGFALFCSTPRGKSHMWEMYNIAISNPDVWFTSKLTIEDTQHISLTEIRGAIARGEISEDLAQQEYWTSWDLGVEGTVYGKYVDKLRLNGQISHVPYLPEHRVNTAWDIGRDTTAIVFWQNVGQIIRIIDYYEKAGENLEHFVRVLEDKKYIYNKHFFPHDMRVTEWAGPKFTRVEKARQLGLKALIVDDVGLADGIEYGRAVFTKAWIDEKKCVQLIKCLENYQYVYDPIKRNYSREPLHNYASHGSDAWRYMAISYSKCGIGTTPQELEKRYQEAMGRTLGIPDAFHEPDRGLF